MIERLERVVIAAHRPLAGDPRFEGEKPRGGETSVAIIRDHLALTYPVLVPVHNVDSFASFISESDVILTWGQAAEPAAAAALVRGRPYILMVRWWRNICTLPPGDIMNRTIPPDFKARKQRLIDEAFAVIANNRFTGNVVKYHYGRTCDVSYVPVTGEVVGNGNRYGPITLVTDDKDLGAVQLISKLAEAMPLHRFLVVNSKRPAYYMNYANISTTGYINDMDALWRTVGILIYPNYRNDVCGTSRVAPEAMRYGIPCLANDRAGICEKGMIPLSRDAEPDEWIAAIERIYADYHTYSDQAITTFEQYDSAKELAVYSRIIKEAFNK